MKIKNIKKIAQAMLTAGLLTALPGANIAFAGNTPLPSNRYNLPRSYESEISAAEAYLNAVVGHERWEESHDRDNDAKDKRPVIVDVRSIPEYVAGHPKGAYNIPYPFIVQDCATITPDGACAGPGQKTPQTDEDFIAAVEQAIPDKDTPIYTLCRTGHRSVLAANLLTADGYNHVRNIWQGFVGQPKVDFFLKGPLDLNHDGQITDEDRDGWRYYQHLPYSKKLRSQLLYQPYLYLYYTN
jgi:rhodanese-related sulfurtransferase